MLRLRRTVGTKRDNIVIVSVIFVIVVAIVIIVVATVIDLPPNDNPLLPVMI